MYVCRGYFVMKADRSDASSLARVVVNAYENVVFVFVC